METDIWQQTLSAIEARIEEQSFRSWFIPIKANIINNNGLLLIVPNQYFKDWLIERYLTIIQEELYRTSLGKIKDISISCEGEEHLPTESISLKKEIAPIITKTTNQSSKFDDFSVNSEIQQLFGDFTEYKPLESNPISTNDITPHNNEEKSIKTKSSSSKKPLRAPNLKLRDKSLFTNIPFNLSYSFNNFVEGPSNNFATMAAKATVEHPAKTYNPLFIYGISGLGKTHLLHAIGIMLYEKFNFKNIIFKSAERFVNELISCLRHKKMDDFHNVYRNCDALLIDDIQGIKGKEATQEEFFHTFNALQQDSKQIVITSDQLPETISNIDERLRSRFKGGLIADVQPPGFEHRMAILLKKSEKCLVPVPHDVIEYIATNIKANVRELEGALNQLTAFASLTGNPITLETSIDGLKNLIDKCPKPRVTIEIIQKTVANYFSIKISDLKSDSKSKNIAQPRQIAMYLCKELLSVSFSEVGEKFGGKDHSTVLYSVNKKVKNRLKKDHDLLHTINVLKRQLSES